MTEDRSSMINTITGRDVGFEQSGQIARAAIPQVKDTLP